MTPTIQIDFENLDDTPGMNIHICDRVEALARQHPNVVGCRVLVGQPHRHRRQGDMFSARVDVSIPGIRLVTAKQGSDDAYVALREAFEAAQRQLAELARNRASLRHQAGAGKGIMPAGFPHPSDDARETCTCDSSPFAQPQATREGDSEWTGTQTSLAWQARQAGPRSILSGTK